MGIYSSDCKIKILNRHWVPSWDFSFQGRLLLWQMSHFEYRLQILVQFQIFGIFQPRLWFDLKWCKNTKQDK